MELLKKENMSLNISDKKQLKEIISETVMEYTKEICCLFLDWTIENKVDINLENYDSETIFNEFLNDYENI